jgi:hypothetical protein
MAGQQAWNDTGATIRLPCRLSAMPGLRPLPSLIAAAALLAVGSATLTACTRMRVEDFAHGRPELVLEQFFTGPIRGWGIVQDRFGRLQRQFRVEAEGEWDAAQQTLLLTETWRFDDGQVDRLAWRISKVNTDRYRGREARLIGEAVGEQAGNAFRWRYTRRVPMQDGSDTRLDFDDWFWLQEGDVLVSRATVGRFGVEFASISLFYQKPNRPVVAAP